MTQPPPRCSFLFGVELELLLQPKQHIRGGTWTDAAESLAQLLDQKKIQNSVVDSEEKKTPNYKHWNIAKDGSIRPQGPQIPQWGMELISDISHDTKRSNWAKVQKVVWDCVECNFIIKPSNSCGTHIHVSLASRRGFDLQRMKRLGKAVVYFERCIDSIMPDHRRRSKYCRSNRYNATLENLSMAEIFDAIEASRSHAELAELLSPGRLFRWNFRHMADPARRVKAETVEFRQPPGSTTIEQALFWQRFTLCFVGGALTLREPLNQQRVATLPQLARVVQHGTLICRSVHDRGFEEFFNGKEHIGEGKLPETGSVSKQRAPVKTQDQTGELQHLKMEEALQRALFNKT